MASCAPLGASPQDKRGRPSLLELPLVEVKKAHVACRRVASGGSPQVRGGSFAHGEVGWTCFVANHVRRFGSWIAGAHGKSITYEGLTLHEPSKAHKFVAYAMSSVMWCVSRPGWNQTRVRGRTSSASLTEQRT